MWQLYSYGTSSNNNRFNILNSLEIAFAGNFVQFMVFIFNFGLGIPGFDPDTPDCTGLMDPSKAMPGGGGGPGIPGGGGGIPGKGGGRGIPGRGGGGGIPGKNGGGGIPGGGGGIPGGGGGIPGGGGGIPGGGGGIPGGSGGIPGGGGGIPGGGGGIPGGGGGIPEGSGGGGNPKSGGGGGGGGGGGIGDCSAPAKVSGTKNEGGGGGGGMHSLECKGEEAATGKEILGKFMSPRSDSFSKGDWTFDISDDVSASLENLEKDFIDVSETGVGGRNFASTFLSRGDIFPNATESSFTGDEERGKSVLKSVCDDTSLCLPDVSGGVLSLDKLRINFPISTSFFTVHAFSVNCSKAVQKCVLQDT